MKFSLKGFGSKGLNLDALASELPIEYLSNATNIRIRNGFPERVGGIDDAHTASATFPWWLSLFQTPNSPTTGCWIPYVDATQAYAWDLSVTDSVITHYTEGVVISSATNVTTTATINTATAHGRTTGQTISVWGMVPDAYNGTFTITVVDADTFTYTMLSDPGGSATTIGLYSYNGTRGSYSNSFTLPDPQQYSGGVLNGIFILNSPANGLYYWAGDTSIPLRKIPGSYKARVSRPFGNYIVQLCPTISSVEYTRRLAWSNAAEPGAIPTSFTASDTNDAGDAPLADGGELVDCLPLGDANIIYSEDGRWAMRYVGGVKVFEFTKLPGSDGLLYRGAVVDTPVGHVFLSRSREVLLHNGGECRNLSQGRVQSLLQTIAVTDGAVSFLVKNPGFNEVWVCFKTGSGSACNEVLIWNWVDDTWGTKTLTGYELTAGVSGATGSHPFLESLFLGVKITASSNGYVGRAEGANDDLSGAAVPAMIERKGLDLGDADVIKNLQRSRWNIDATAGNAFQVYHGSHMTADATPTYASAATYTLGTTDYVNSRATGGRFLAVKITWSFNMDMNGDTAQVENQGRVRSGDLDVTMGGKR